jgi:hypothetical protein
MPKAYSLHGRRKATKRKKKIKRENFKKII